MVENPIQNIISGGATIRPPDQIRDVNSEAVSFDVNTAILNSGLGALVAVNDALVVGDAEDAVSSFISEDDIGTLSQATNTKKRITASTSSASGKASAALRLSAEKTKLIAQNPHLEQRINNIFSPGEQTRAYQVGQAIAKGEADATEARVEGAMAYATTQPGLVNQTLDVQIAAYNASQIHLATKQAEIDGYDLIIKKSNAGAAQQGAIVAKETAIMIQDVTGKTNIINSALTMGRANGVALWEFEASKGNSFAAQTLDTLKNTKDDVAYKTKLVELGISIWENSKGALSSKVLSGSGIVDAGAAGSDLSSFNSTADAHIKALQGGSLLEYAETKEKTVNASVIADFIAKNPEVHSWMTVMQKYSSVTGAMLKTVKGRAIEAKLVAMMAASVTALKANVPPPIDPTGETDEAQVTASLVSASSKAIISEDTPPEALKEAVSLVRAQIKGLVSRPRDYDKSAYESILHSMSTDGGYKKVTEGEGRVTDETAAIFATQYVDNVYMPSYREMITRSLGPATNETGVPETGGAGTLFNDPQQPEQGPVIRGFQGISFTVSSKGRLNFIVNGDSELTTERTLTAKSIVSQLNAKVQGLNSAIRLGSTASNADPKEYARLVGSNILGLKKSTAPEQQPVPVPKLVRKKIK